MNDLKDSDVSALTEQPKPESRTCANCACSVVRKHPVLLNEDRMFCARNTVNSHIMRVGKPRIDPATKQPVMDKRTQKPIIESVDDLVFLYMPTMPELTCYDGWRPLGTLPGDFSYRTGDVAELTQKFMDGFKRLQQDVIAQLESDLNLAALDAASKRN